MEYITFIEGDLLNLPDIDMIAHQVNCKGVMGSGLARQIKYNFPNIFESYRIICKRAVNSSILLGKCHIVSRRSIDNPKYVVNLFGQDGYGYNGTTMGGDITDYRRQQHTDIPALEEALTKLKLFAKIRNLSIAIPYKIGCGRGGAEWDKVLLMIEKVFNDYPVTIVKLKEE